MSFIELNRLTGLFRFYLLFLIQLLSIDLWLLWLLLFIFECLRCKGVIWQPIRVRMLLFRYVVANNSPSSAVSIWKRACQLVHVLLWSNCGAKFVGTTADGIDAAAAEHEVGELATCDLILTFRDLRYWVVRVTVALRWVVAGDHRYVPYNLFEVLIHVDARAFSPSQTLKSFADSDFSFDLFNLGLPTLVFDFSFLLGPICSFMRFKLRLLFLDLSLHESWHSSLDCLLGSSITNGFSFFI